MACGRTEHDYRRGPVGELPTHAPIPLVCVKCGNRTITPSQWARFYAELTEEEFEAALRANPDKEA